MHIQPGYGETVHIQPGYHSREAYIPPRYHSREAYTYPVHPAIYTALRHT